MSLTRVIEDLNADPHRERSFYDYPELYDFYHDRALNRDAQTRLLERHRPDETRRVLELGCGTGPLLVRIEDEYEEVLGVDANERMLERARERVRRAEMKRGDFTEWSAADEGRTFDAAVLFGGILHLTDEEDVRSLAENVRDGLRDGGAFITFFEPLTDDVANGSFGARTVESDRFRVERHETSALTSPAGHYTTTYVFVVRDRETDTEATMGTTFRGRFHDPESLRTTFLDAGFDAAELLDDGGPTMLRAVR